MSVAAGEGRLAAPVGQVCTDCSAGEEGGKQGGEDEREGRRNNRKDETR